MKRKRKLSDIAKQLGQRGGKKTAKRGKAYYKRIGKMGLEKRWGKKYKEATATTDNSGVKLSVFFRESYAKLFTECRNISEVLFLQFVTTMELDQPFGRDALYDRTHYLARSSQRVSRIHLSITYGSINSIPVCIEYDHMNVYFMALIIA